MIIGYEASGKWKNDRIAEIEPHCVLSRARKGHVTLFWVRRNYARSDFHSVEAAKERVENDLGRPIHWEER